MPGFSELSAASSMSMTGSENLAKQLIPFAPIARRQTIVDLDQVNTIVGKLGFNEGERLKERDEAYEEFDRVAAGEHDAGMTEERFIAVAAQLWGLERLSARAVFHASDLNYSGRLHAPEYLLLREAFIHQRPVDHDIPEEILEIQLRAAFNRYVLARPAQRIVRGTVLTRTEAVELVRDLCSGDTHVRKLAADLLPQLMQAGLKRDSAASLVDDLPTHVGAEAAESSGGEEEDHLTVNEFVSTLMQERFREQLAAKDLSIRDLVVRTLRGERPGRQFAGHPGATCSRVVLDGRAESATMAWRPASDLEDRLGDEAANYPARSRGIVSAPVPRDAINEEMRLTPQVRAVGGWRGPLAPNRDTEEYRIAHQVIEGAMRLAHQVSEEEDVLDKRWAPDGEALKAMLGPGEARQAQMVAALAAACRVQLAAQSNLVRVKVPCKVFGDVHGQFRDLLLLLDQFGFPYHCGGDIQTTNYVFNGDFVDRGEHQLEVVVLLFALKTLYPSSIFLIRGNHEFREMSEMGSSDCFMRHMKWRLPQQWKIAYDAIHQAFDWLPMAALVGGQALVLHGGLGDGTWGLKDIEGMRRPLEKPSLSIELDIVWSDPSDSDHIMWKGVHENPDRGDTKIHLFGPDVTAAFCEREHVCVVIRSHQFVPQGYKVMHSGRLLTVFSARNYFGEDENDGALLLLAPDHNGHLRVHPKRLLATPLPELLEDFEAGSSESEGAALRGAGGDRKGTSARSSPWKSVGTICSNCFAFVGQPVSAKQSHGLSSHR